MNQTISHTVQPGDTLTRIAMQYEVSIPEIRKLNPGIHDVNKIMVGQVIIIPVPGPLEPPKIEPPWLQIARRELGVSEIPGPRANQRIIEYHASTTLSAISDEVPWCSAFACWCMEQAGIRSTRSAAARSWLTWGKPILELRVGAVAIFSRGTGWQGHVGFPVGESSTHIDLIGGNQGNRVSIARYPKSSLLGLRWPA